MFANTGAAAVAEADCGAEETEASGASSGALLPFELPFEVVSKDLAVARLRTLPKAALQEAVHELEYELSCRHSTCRRR